MSPQHAAVRQLRRRRLGVPQIVFFTVAASAPLTVLGGGVTTTFAVAGIPGVPLSFLILALALSLFAVGYAAMSRHVANAGAFYSYLANGLGRSWGVSGSFVALLTYNAIGIGLYGLFGISLEQFIASKTDVDISWWIYAFGALLVVAILGVLRIDLNAHVLAFLLTLECIAVVLYDIGSFSHPAAHVSYSAGMDPSKLFVSGVGAVFALGVAAFTGFESGAIYSEECVNPRRTVARATYIALAFTGIFYAISAWAMTVNVGSGNLQAAATQNGPGLVFGSLAQNFDPLIADLANVLFLTSVFAALLSFHNGVARYFFALGRERVLPAWLGRIGARSGGPVAGSLAQTTLAAIVVAIFAISHSDPLLQLFTWFSGISAVGVILLMTGTSASVIGFFRRRKEEATLWQRTVAPALATLVLGALVVLLVTNFDALLGPADANGPLRWIFPALPFVAAFLGLIWAHALKVGRADIFSGIGRSGLTTSTVEPEPEQEKEFILPRLRQ